MDSTATLESQIELLTDVYNRVQTLRQVPPILLRPSVSFEPFTTQTIRGEFHRVKEVGDLIRSAPTQEALNRAQKSLEADTTGLDANPRRENRKRRRGPSPESPQPYVSVDQGRTSLFPPSATEAEALTASTLAEYVKSFNRSNGDCRLHIWARTKGQTMDSQPKMIRFTIPNILTAYIGLVYTESRPTVLTIIPFGPREKKAPHSQSDYSVYQQLSQQLAKMLQTEGNVTLPMVMSLLCSYRGLFIDACKSCGRVVSSEGYTPPVVRVWRGDWEARHGSCF